MTDADSEHSAIGFKWPNAREKIWLAIAAIAILGMLILTLRQTLALGRGDAQVFFRAGWAAWEGYPLYQVTDHHGWSYHYPPVFALLMGPFADPLPGYSHPAWALSYPLSLTLWYALGVAAFVGAIQMLADAIARFSGAQARAGAFTPYWALRLFPPLALLVFIGAGWLRGQPTTILVLLIVMFLVFLCHRRPLAASLALSLAIAIKMFPAVFLLIPILRRDFRTIGYTAILVFVLLFAFPVACLGLQATIGLYQALWTERLRGLITGEVYPRIADELSPWSIQIVSLGSMLARIFATPAPEAPYRLPAWAGYAQFVFDIAIMAAIAGIGYRRFWRLKGAQPSAPYPILLAGAILFAALPAMLPVARLHYWAIQIPLIAILFANGWRRCGDPTPSAGQIAWAAAALIAFAATGPNIPGLLSRLGPTTIVMLAPVVAGFLALWRFPPDNASRNADSSDAPRREVGAPDKLTASMHHASS